MAREFRAGVPVDKGTVVEGLVATTAPDAALFAGDDHGDLAAFDALDRLETSGALARRGARRRGVDRGPRRDRRARRRRGRRPRRTRRAARRARRRARTARRALTRSGSAQLRRRRGRDLVLEPLRCRVRGREAAELVGPLRSLVGLHRERAVQRVGGLLDVVGVHLDDCRSELVERTGAAREADDDVARAEQRTLLGDEVEAVAERVDQQHVGAAQSGDRPREVVAGCRARSGASPSVAHRSFTRWAVCSTSWR